MNNFPPSEVKYPFTAKEPYSINVMGVMQSSNLWGASRTHDFCAPFVNPVTGFADPAQMQACGINLNSAKITNAGFVGSIEKFGSATTVRYNAGDPITAGKCRTQLNSYAIPPRTHVRWELGVAFGSVDNPWVLTPSGASPVLFWQVKSPAGGHPAMAAEVDTDQHDSSSLRMRFFMDGGLNGQAFASPVLVGEVDGLKLNTNIDIVIEAFLDEREVIDGGKGCMIVSVNGTQLCDVLAPTLVYGAGKHNWSMCTYLYNEKVPYANTRASFWTTAMMFVYP